MRFCQTGLIALVFAACDGKEEPLVDTGDEPVTDEVPDTITPPTDDDGDGYAAEDDCDDTNANIHPGLAESCDGVDNNCNGVVDESFGDSDGDGTADCIDAEECDGLDNDGDGSVDEDFTDADGDGQADCLQIEECDGLDNDGDGTIDEGFDADGDGYSPCAEGALLDCDDTNADISPSAAEVDGDAVDNDCDGSIDEGSWSEGDLVITEIFNNPLLINDTVGEWFEIHNVSGEDRLLAGLLITDGAGEAHRIADAGLWLADGAYLVLGINGDTSTNGGVAVDYVYADLSLSNEADTLILEVDGLVIDQVSWDEVGGMPDVSGSSMSLDPLYLDAAKNDQASAWCDSAWPDLDSAEQVSTPGAENALCASVDHDGDGFSQVEGDCDDTQDDIGPGSEEIAYDGIDNDCDPTSPDDDLDADGYGVNADCDDTDPRAWPGNAEVCDGIDNDCNGDADDDDAGVIDAKSWYPDDDGDGYGDADGAAIVSCSAISGMVEDNNDCDDADAAYSPAAIEDDCDDPEDYNCDGLPAFVDEDLDGFSACDADCDDTDARVFPYAWEDTADGIDNDCDGDTDSDDTDVPLFLTMGDDTYTSVAMATVFPFCSTDWSSVYVASNGRLTFGTGSSSYSYGAAALASDVSIAGVWNDLNPGSGGRVAVQDFDDATGIYFLDVREYGSSQTLTFSMIMLDDGRVVLSYGDIGIDTGMVGWSCGAGGSSSESDLTAEAADVPAGSLGIGQGTEDMLYELFSSSGDANDLSGQTFVLCVGSGVDADGDGWTDECGDLDDRDSSVSP